ncbi:kynurenine formamidase-like [Prunus yedoensis var. nudiflora]|uniref:Kynurenine formamidase-like n=1 Tax=Prunus yedoensis var. nudiflora TaxID=2094558 RepID=A0A314UMJ2_PRUYE|nr:kynurenine formamidase-like [Prunus yedoensis var. nudiflora]
MTMLTSDVAYPTVPDDCLLSGEGVPVSVQREVYHNGRIFDISHKYVPDMPSFGVKDGLGEFLWLGLNMKNGSLVNVCMMKFNVHSGMHVDAPGHVFDHFYDAEFDVDTLDLEVLNGPTVVVDVPRDKNITVEVMKALNIPRGVRCVLFRTSNTDRNEAYVEEGI